MADENGDQRAYFVINGLAQPLKLKLATKSALKNLFAHVPYSHANITPEFYWEDLRLDANCCPADYGMLAGPNHVHHIQAKLPLLPEPSGGNAAPATARVYQSMQPMSLLGAMAQSPQPVQAKQASPPKAAQLVPTASTARLIDELQYAVKVHSESAMRLNEQLLATQKDLAEVTTVMSKENRKLTERVLELEEQVRVKEQLRQEQVQQSIASVHQHFTAFEQEREARREEVDSLQKLVKAVTQEKDVFAQRNEELSRTLHQRDEEWAADLEHFTGQMKKAQHNALLLEGRIAELSSVQSSNARLQAERNELKPIADREPKLLDEIEKLREQVDALQAHLMSANANALSLQNTLAAKERSFAEEQTNLENEVAQLKENLSEQSNVLHEAIQRNATRPSEAQLHAKIREVVAHNQRLVLLIKQPSAASSQHALSPSVPPGVQRNGRNASPPTSMREHSLEMSQSHWNESVQRAASYDRPQATGTSAMERMYPPAETMVEPANVGRNDRPSAPRLSQRIVAEQPRVVTRQDVRRESVRQWVDEELVGDEHRRESAYDLARRQSVRAPQQLASDDVHAMRSVASMRQRSPSAGGGAPPSPAATRAVQRSPAEAQQAAPRVSRSRSVGDIRTVSPSGNIRRVSMRSTDDHGRPAIPRRASMSLSQSPTRGDEEQAPVPQPEIPRRASSIRQVQVSPLTVEEPPVAPVPVEAPRGSFRGSPQNADAPRVPLSRAAQSMRQPSPTAGADFRQARSAGDLRRAAEASSATAVPPPRRATVVHQTAPVSREYEDIEQSPSSQQRYQSPRGTGGEAEAHEPEQEIIVEFEDEGPSGGGDVVAPARRVSEVAVAQQSFVPRLEGPSVMVVEEPVSESMIAERSTASGSALSPNTRSGMESPRRFSSVTSFKKTTDNRPRQEPEIDSGGISFNRAKSTFANSTALTGPSAPYVAPLRKVQSAQMVTREPRAQHATTERTEGAVQPNPTNPYADIVVEESVVYEEDPAHAAAVEPAQPVEAVPQAVLTPSSPHLPALISPQSDTPRQSTPRLAQVLCDTPRNPRSSAVSAPVAAEEPSSLIDEVSEPRADATATPLDGDSDPGHERIASRPVSYDATGVAAEVFGTIGEMFDAATAAGGARSAMVFVAGESQPPTNVSWKKYNKAAKQFGRAVVGDGLPLGSKIAIVGENSAEWALSYLGSILAGCCPVGINPRLSPEEARRQIEQVAPRILVVDSPKTMKQFLLTKTQTPTIRRIVVCHGAIPPRVKETYRDFVYAFEEFLDRAQYATPDAMAEREASASTEQCATISFTSGVTQQPKPVLLSHDNLLFSAWSTASALELPSLVQGDGNVRLASHMTLSDVVYQVMDIVMPIVAAAKLGLNVVTYYSRVAEKGNTYLLRAAKPTVFAASPTIWKSLFELADSEGVEQQDTRAFLGLDESSLLLWGGGPWNHGSCLSTCQHRNLDVVEFYSSVETSGIAITSSLRRRNFASCGVRLPGTEIRFVPQDGRDEEGHGEMQFFGRHVAIGYLKYPSMTQQAFLEDGFYLSEDVAGFDESGFVYFDGKASDFVMNSENHFVALRRVEEGVEVACPIASRIVAFGSNRPSVICLISLKTKRDPVTGRETEELHPDAAGVNPNVRTVSEARIDPSFQHAISKAIQAFNNGTSCVSPAHKVVRFAFFQSVPSYETDELTVNGKLRRFITSEKYSNVIDKLYEQGSTRKLKRRIASDSPMAAE